ncbi:hypothetical protein [Streptomyces sp. TLI_55]|uniref:hypothetical protein n=1 Tax=Streptomyces sp. TLI_55 TaxID=1938861 RepID=UPI0015CF5A4E|nr:hypothetical protein [Streptomyces sp. TLI_55]
MPEDGVAGQVVEQAGVSCQARPDQVGPRDQGEDLCRGGRFRGWSPVSALVIAVGDSNGST